MTFKKLNNITGWLAGLIATIVYFLTLEPTVSWWDCGEYISTAYKLQVGHPPGAPLFQMIGRFFSLFAGGDVSKVAMMVNVMSALCSGLIQIVRRIVVLRLELEILFLHWVVDDLSFRGSDDYLFVQHFLLQFAQTRVETDGKRICTRHF